ncbi:lysis protein [Pseudomonas japonica]|uniref:lysis protein n=1 Tax=Pseudomonas japonica TaxID=256466 RepID=UPI003A85E822
MSLDWRLPAAALLLGLGLGGGAAWQWQENAYQWQLAQQITAYQQERLEAGLAVVDWNNKVQAQRTELESRLQMNDATYTQELQDARQIQARLRDRVATADLRLSVLLASPDAVGGCGVSAPAGTTGVVHAAARAQLDPAHAQRIVAIVGDGDEGLIALQACQAFLRAVSLR